MKTLYLECSMGAAGDMLTAALLELVDREVFLEKMSSLGLPDTVVSAEKVIKRGISGTQVTVSVKGMEEESCDVHEHHIHHLHDHYIPPQSASLTAPPEGEPYGSGHDHGHDHRHVTPKDIDALLDGLDLPEKVRNDSKAVYGLLAEAESHVHGRHVDEIHFHEVGTLDAVADIVGVCLLMDMIRADRVIVSSVNTGSGHVRCAHGILPVPAPATAFILNGVPVYSGRTEGELCTPTGAALLKYFADDFGKMPAMRIQKTGYGFGKKDFEELNCVRAFLSEDTETSGQVLELKCNLDDMTPEHIGFATDMLWEAGALDVFTTPVMMKKNRPAVLLTVLCKPGDREKMVREIFKHTTTIGIRETVCDRFVLEREEELLHTEYGDVSLKKVRGYGVSRSKPEYDDLAEIAREKHTSIMHTQKELEGKHEY